MLTRRLPVALLSVAFLVGTAQSSPIGADKTPSNSQAEKYFPTDTAGLISIDVQQVVKSKVYEDQAKPLVELGLKHEKVAPILKQAGLEPLRDISRVTIPLAPSLFRFESQALPGGGVSTSSGSGMFVVLEGKFDPKKIHTTAEKFAEDGKTVVLHKVGDGHIYEIGFPTGRGALEHSYFSVPDARTVVICTHRDFVEETIKIASRKDPVVPKQVQELAKLLDRTQTVTWAINEDAVISQSISTTQAGNAPPIVKVQTTHFRDMGGKQATGGVKLGENIVFSAKIEFQKAEKVKETVQVAEMIRDMAAQQFPAVGKGKDVDAVVESMKKIKVEAKDNTVTISGDVKGKFVGLLVQYWMASSRDPQE